MSGLLDASVSQLQSLSAVIDDVVTQSVGDLTSLFQLHDVSCRLQAELKLINSRIEFLLLAAMGAEKEKTLPDGRIAKKVVEFKEVYEPEKVRAAYGKILRTHSIDPDTGEIILRPEAAEKIVDVLMACMGASKPKKQAMKAHNINIQSLFTMGKKGEKVYIEEPEASHPLASVKAGGAK